MQTRVDFMSVNLKEGFFLIINSHDVRGTCGYMGGFYYFVMFKIFLNYFGVYFLNI